MSSISSRLLRPFRGKVRSYSAELKAFLIVYEDGDREHLDKNETRLIVERAAAVAKAALPVGAAKKPIDTLKKGAAAKTPAKRKAVASSSKRGSAVSKVNFIDNYRNNNNSNKRSFKSPPRRSSVYDDDENDLLLPYNPRFRTISPGSNRENANRNASGSGKAAAAASKMPPTKTPGLDNKKFTEPRVKSTTTTNNNNKKTKRPSAEVLALLPPEVEQNTRYVYPPGQEPWRKVASALAIPVYENPDTSPAAVKVIHECKQQYYRHYRQAELDETARVEATGGIDPATGKALSKRPDRVTESWMKKQRKAVHQTKRVGYVAGICVNQRFYARSEMSCVGMHLMPVAGIEIISRDVTGLGIPIAASIVCAGCYEDDKDSGDELIFTGEGGNDLLGNKKQVAAQELRRGNEALVGNIRLGLPVRVTRKNKDKHGIYGIVLIFDGLYDVVEYWLEPGKEGHLVYRFRLVRCPEQGELLSHAVTFGGMSAPKQLVPLGRPGIVDVDITNGQEKIPIPAVNETDDNEIPPCTALERIPEESSLLGVDRGITSQALNSFLRQRWHPTVEYVTEYKYTQGIVPPPAPVLPLQFRNDPHAYITTLNHGRLPYLESRNGKLVQLREALPVVYECGPWTGCLLGTKCPQAVTQQGILYRLEIFKTTDGRGWGVRSLDMIPQFAFICDYYGEIYQADFFKRLCQEEHHNGDYSMDMAVRPDRDWDGNTTEDRSTAENTEYVVCGLKKRNIAAFLNHSCAPNCFAQPVLAEHHDSKMPKISVFASEDIAPFTQLTWDYGEDYASCKFDAGCKCGAVDCISLRTDVGNGVGAGGTPPSGSGRKETR